MTTIASPVDAAQAYFAAWNRRDPSQQELPEPSPAW